MNKLKIGYAMCGSFCTIASSIKALKALKSKGYDIYPIFSPIVQNSDTRFTDCRLLAYEVESICEKKIIRTIPDAEPIGPKKMFDVLAVCPCTGNTLAKIAYGITDTSVTMAVKAHIRNNRPTVIALATNDALGAAAKNIGTLLNTKNFYFVPFSQDDPLLKERSMIANFNLLEDTVLSAMNGEQLKPIIC